jgi:hypothetical protein
MENIELFLLRVILCSHTKRVLCSWRIFERTSDIVDGKHISLSQKSGMSYKRLYKKENLALWFSDNPIYEPYEVMFSSVLEIWRYAV